MKHTVRIPGMPREIEITVNTQEVGGGIFDMLAGDHKALVAFGMVPKELDDIIEGKLAELFDASVEQVYGMPPGEIDLMVSALHEKEIHHAADERKVFVAAATKQIIVALFHAAARAGKMIV